MPASPSPVPLDERTSPNSKLNAPCLSVYVSVRLLPSQIVCTAAGSVNGVPSSTTTFPERKMVALLAGAVILGLSLVPAMPRPVPVWAEAENAKTRTRNGAETSGLFMASPHKTSCIICLMEPEIGFSAWPGNDRIPSVSSARAPAEIEWPRVLTEPADQQRATICAVYTRQANPG